ncbi:MAG: hypothetical protein LKF06_00540 [Prevotella sp.]|nr:hypothetical protein [Prevotella sp.]
MASRIRLYTIENPKDARKNKPVFPFGFLNNHVSGIDITFEKGNCPKEAVRASMLIREFEVDGETESRSTMMYEALYQQASVFDGFSIKWVDGEKEVAVESSIRKMSQNTMIGVRKNY